jgi:hypothetical protein
MGLPEKARVLVFPAGSEIGLEIHASLKYSHHVELYGASGKSDHASFVYEPSRYHEDPALYVDRPDFIERVNEIVSRWRIRYIYPTHDTIACFLAENAQRVDAMVVTSPAETNRIARSKSLTYRRFESLGLCPRVYGAGEMPTAYPVFLKPDQGQGGKGARVAHSAEELAFYLARAPDLLVTEHLPGDELSVDCFTDSSGTLRFVGPRTRDRVQMGISFRSASVPLTEEIRGFAEAINRELRMDGAWFFQVKRDAEGQYKLLEFAPRQASTMGLYRHAGVNFALLSLFNAMRLPVEVEANNYDIVLDRCLHNRFKATMSFTRAYIDFDETIIADGRVHERVMAFLYQCRNLGVRLVLLTKHRCDLADSLAAHAISPALFESIIHLGQHDEKWRSIDPEGAIFIDNYWHDRKVVRQNLGIPVFDVDAVECLLR